MGLSLHIIIPTHHRKDWLLHLLGLIFNQEAMDLHHEVCIVLSGPDPDTVTAISEQYPDCSLIIGEEDWWWTVSVNRGILQALQKKADAVLLLNDDITITKAYLHALINAAQNHPNAIIGSLNLTHEPEPRLFFSGARSYNWMTGNLERYHRFLSPCPEHLTGVQKSVVLPGRGLWIPVSVFAKIGFFDQKELPHYKADYDFVYRAQANGIQTVICWDAIVYNPAQETGCGATFVKQRLWDFLPAMFNEHSRSNLRQNITYYLRLHPRWALPFFPVTAIMILSRQLACFFRHKKYPSVQKKNTETVATGVPNL